MPEWHCWPIPVTSPVGLLIPERFGNVNPVTDTGSDPSADTRAADSTTRSGRPGGILHLKVTPPKYLREPGFDLNRETSAILLC